MQTMCSGANNAGVQMQQSCEFIKRLSPDASRSFAAIATSSSYPAKIILFQEQEESRYVYVILEGEVKLSINSSDGRRLSVRIARKGEILGLASALTGKPHDMTAETLYPAKLAPIGRREFMGFLTRYPAAHQSLSVELSREFAMTCDHLRRVGLAASVPEKLARLLLDWSDKPAEGEGGSRLRFAMTHEAIGEFIGASREAVTRALSRFRERRLVMSQGATLTIPSRAALEDYAHA